MNRIFILMLAVISSLGMSIASAQEVDKEHEVLVNNVWYELGPIDCDMTKYVDPEWLNPDKPLITINKQTGSWDFVQGTAPDEATLKAMNLWMRDASDYHACYKAYVENLQKNLHLVVEYHNQYVALHNLNQSHIVEVSQKVLEFTEANPVSKKFGWQYILLCGRLYANTVTEEEARKWADCSVRYEKKLVELIAVIRSRAAIEQADYLERLFKTTLY